MNKKGKGRYHIIDTVLFDYELYGVNIISTAFWIFHNTQLNNSRWRKTQDTRMSVRATSSNWINHQLLVQQVS